MHGQIKTFGELMQKRAPKKAPAYQWQELALKVIDELNIPKNKRSSVFQICKKHSRVVIEKALNDTKELCKTGEQWRYFFKLIDLHADPSRAAKKNALNKKGDLDSPF